MIRLSSLLFLLPPTLYLHLVDLRLPRPATPGFLSAHPPCEAVESDNTYSRRLPAAASDPPLPLPPLLPGATTACGEPLLQPCSAQMTRCVAGSVNLKGRRAALHILMAVAPCTALSGPRHRPCPPLPYYPLRQPHLPAAAGPDLQPEVHLQAAGACGQEVREGGEGREAEDQKGDREGCVRRKRPPSWPLCLCIQHVLGSRLRPPGGIAQARMQACGRPRPKGTTGLFPPHVTPHPTPTPVWQATWTAPRSMLRTQSARRTRPSTTCGWDRVWTRWYPAWTSRQRCRRVARPLPPAAR